MTALLANPAQRRECGRDNRRFWQAELTPERFAQRYPALLERTGLLRVAGRQALAKAG